MKMVIASGLAAALAVLLIPTGFAGTVNVQPKVEDRVVVIEDKLQEKQTLHLLHGQTVTETDADDYLTGVVLSEMPASFESEALKAQAVAARTFLLRRMQCGKHENADVCADSVCCQAWTDTDTLREKFGGEFDAVWEKAGAAVRETRNEVLTYHGELIEATYFSCSGGRTESALAVWGSDVPYLQSVESYGEEAALRYASSVEATAEEFARIIREAEPTAALDGEPQTWIGKIEYTSGNGVAQMQIGGVSFSGTRMRSLFGLNSTQFAVSYRDGVFRFDVHGFGHRVGMSQYGANYMAQQGYDYRVILQYYYRGAEIRKLSREEAS